MEYGMKEVPNIRLIFLNKGTQTYTLDIDTVTDYSEDIGADYTDVTIRWALIKPQDYEYIKQHEYTEILMYRSMIIRSAETGEDELFFPSTLSFNKATFSYYLETRGDPARWTIRLQS